MNLPPKSKISYGFDNVLSALVPAYLLGRRGGSGCGYLCWMCNPCWSL